MPEIIEALVDGGKASAGAPLGPALGPKGVNIMQVITAINDKTKQFQGMKVPVKIIIDPKTKEFTVEVGTPPAASLILREVGAEKGSGVPSKSKIGNLTIDQAVKIREDEVRQHPGQGPQGEDQGGHRHLHVHGSDRRG